MRGSERSPKTKRGTRGHCDLGEEATWGKDVCVRAAWRCSVFSPPPIRQLLALAEGRAAAAAAEDGAKSRLRLRASSAEALPLDHAGADPGKTSVQQGRSDVRGRYGAVVRDCFIRRVEALLVVRRRLIDFLSSNIQMVLCSRELQGHPGVWIIPSPVL